MKTINSILEKFNVDSKHLVNYGQYIAKLQPTSVGKSQGKLILVTSTSPTPAGEGKTTTSINLADTLNYLKHKTIVALREPSLGPCFGVKGGATGGGKIKILPENDINLHFTGDIHAITAANNLIAAMIDNNIFWKTKLNIDPKKIMFKRVMDMNDRGLRDVVVKLSEEVSYKTGFDITAACEIMTIFCLSKDKEDFIKRLENILVAYSTKNKPVFVKDLKITNAIMGILRDCFLVNAVQTNEGNLAFVQGGPFANISIGISTVRATKLALGLADYTITEAGFGSDLGGEKFLNIVCQESGLVPNCIVLVTTIRSITYQGQNNLKAGLKNLGQHIDHISQYKLPFVVAINEFADDKDADKAILNKFLKEKKVDFAYASGFKNGVKGGVDLAKLVVKKATAKPKMTHLYKTSDSIKTKIEKIVKNCYGINTLQFSNEAKTKIAKLKEQTYYVCMSKKPNQIHTSLVNNKPAVIVQDILINHGSKLIVVLCDKVFRMPGLSEHPKAESF